MNKLFSLALISLLSVSIPVLSQVIPVGSGSYTKTFPGTDVLGRNLIPSGTPQVSGNAIGKPAPTSDWWSALIKNGQASNLFNYPFTMKTKNSGLVVTYIPSGVIDDIEPVTVGVSGMTATKTTVSDFSDWTVTMDWNDGIHDFKTTSGVGMPFLYFTKSAADVAQVTVTSGTVVVSGEMLVITDLRNGADFAVYAPSGSTWSQNGAIYTSTLNGQNYWSMAFIPLTAANVTAVATEYKKYAYVFPVNTTATYSYNESTSVMRTDFNVVTEVKEGSETNMLIGLLPHQWAHLSADSPVPDKYSYTIVRGQMKTMAGNSFSVENTFHGILPTLPYLDNYSTGFSPSALTEKIASLENNTLATWTDSYNEGQVMNQLVQTARIADEMGNIASRNKILSTIKTRLEDWFKAESGEVAFIFYYNTAWSAMIGYPAGYYQDQYLNDRHFHWGYFIHAAAFIEQYEPGWAAQWGGMVNMLVRDAACPDRNDAMFPYLRNFSPYEGHSWADGFAGNPAGNNQESSSESMVFASSLIHWGELTADKTIRDLGIYIYTTEQTGIEEYYMDTKERNFPASQQYSLVSRVWTNSIDNGTFWTSDIAASYGIEIYPIHGGSLYLGLDTAYVAKLWNEVAANTGILNNQVNPNLWHDMWWEYLAFIDPAKAIEMYNSYPEREIKFGISDAQTYHWLHAMNALGRVDAAITADYPVAAAFILHGEINYVAHNYSDAPITVTFSTGYQLVVPARKMVTSKDSPITGILTSSFQQAAVKGSVILNVMASGGTPTKVEFMDGTVSLGSVTTEPYTWNATNLQLGVHSFYAKVYAADKFNVTNSSEIQVGQQLPYGGTAWAIPGTIQAGNYDTYEGGKGQNIAYMDVTTTNSGDFRTDEYVDATSNVTEGAYVGSIAAGEWLEYTVNVTQAGIYSFAFRYASGNLAGGGPFHLQLDGQTISGDISVSATSGTVWTVWLTKNVTGIPLTPGQHVLRLAFSSGEFNLAKMTFTRTGDLAFSYPTALSGSKLILILPQSSATLDGSASTESASQPLTYLWTQNYGPTEIQFSDPTSDKPVISGLVEGMYSLKLTVANTDLRTDEDELIVVVSNTANILPTVSLVSPADLSVFTAGNPVTITANASDFDGSIQKVDFYQDDILISSDDTSPYSATWNPDAGNYILTAVATDNDGAPGNSQEVNVTIAPKMSCTEVSNIATEGVFSLGYKCTFETVGTSVTITFELLDTDKPGLVAYLRREIPFTESIMTYVSDKIFSTTINGQIIGSTISYACKFAFSGGLAVTEYFSYKVGTDCGSSVSDTEKPSSFTATVGTTAANSIELLLQASDNSGNVIYTIKYGTTTLNVSVESGVSKSFFVNGLTPNTIYTFAVSASDLTGNTAENNPISLTASTTANLNTECSGSSFEASEGTFSIGYKYSFVTTGTDVKITFELLDDKSGLNAYLWKKDPFAETKMTSVSGKIFTITISNQTIGLPIMYACKFAYAGGMSVTKYLSYVVGNTCSVTGLETSDPMNQFVFPNPVKNILHLQLLDQQNRIILRDMFGNTLSDGVVPASNTLDMSSYKPGVYLLKIENKHGVQYKKIVKN
jgi:endoglucanase Acf2